MIKNQGYLDQQSIISNASNRKVSRLSNFNPIKSKQYTRDLSNSSSGNNSNNSFYNLAPTQTNTEYQYGSNYHLTKMETNESIDSNYSLQSQFAIDLNLNKKEIELIRFTWNKMLLDEPIVESKSSLPIPGGFQFQSYMSQQSSQQSNGQLYKSQSTIASSLFCRQLYANLLSMDPDLEKLFPSIKHQAVAFAGVLSFAINQLENLSTLNGYLENLGKRHSRILGIEPSMFELMGEAFIQTFHERFGNKFNQELEVLWIKLYLFLANSLLQFGIDPVLKLDEHENTHNNLFKLNEVNFANTLTNQSSNYHSSNGSPNPSNNGPMPHQLNKAPSKSQLSSPNDLFSMDDKRSSISTGVTSQMNSVDSPKKKESTIKKKKRDCVIQ